AGAAERLRRARELWPDPERYAWLVGQLDRSGDHRLERLSIHDVYRLDESGRPWTLSVRTLLRPAGDDSARVAGVHQPGAAAPPRKGAASSPRSGPAGAAEGEPDACGTPRSRGAAQVHSAPQASGATQSPGAPDVRPAAGKAGLARVRYCRPGRVRAEGGLMAFELVFDRVLSAGGTAVVEYALGPVGQDRKSTRLDSRP